MASFERGFCSMKLMKLFPRPFEVLKIEKFNLQVFPGRNDPIV
jgi:hypothetical protein